MGTKTLRLSAIVAVFITAIMLISFIVGWVDGQQLRTTLSKTLLVIAVLALATLVATALANSNKQ